MSRDRPMRIILSWICNEHFERRNNNSSLIHSLYYLLCVLLCAMFITVGEYVRARTLIRLSISLTLTWVCWRSLAGGALIFLCWNHFVFLLRSTLTRSLKSQTDCDPRRWQRAAIRTTEVYMYLPHLIQTLTQTQPSKFIIRKFCLCSRRLDWLRPNQLQHHE